MPARAAMGAAAVLTPGTELAHREDVEELIPQIKIWEIPTKQAVKTFFPADSESPSLFSG